MNLYQNELKQLAALESFDANLFTPCSKDDKKICGLILSFAVAFNDLKDVAMAIRFLKAVTPEVNPNISPEKGQHGGLGVHLMRIEAGIIKELMVLIEDNKSVIESAPFSKLTRKLSSGARNAWQTVLAVAFQKDITHPMARFLLMVRNKIAFHYDPKEISRGYSLAFSQSSNLIPYVSRGNSMPETRFYFADAAAEKYLLSGVDEEVAREFFTGRTPIFHDFNIALFEIITRFVNDRGYAWRAVK